jgi:translation elongation factor EF-1beta
MIGAGDVADSRILKLEEELAKSKLENSDLVFGLKVAKTKVAVLEEKLANIEVDETIEKAERSLS